jgi:DeoR/GlpR family transcriptional regulator of sugar metabolism
MFAAQRREWLLRRLAQNRQIIVNEAAKELNVSEGTIRTDLRLLEEEGMLERTHGGAVPVRAGHQPPARAMPSRGELNRQEKRAIGRRAAEMVRSGQCILLDASSTVFELARCLSEYDYLTVVTNGLAAAEEVGRNPRNNVILIGGILRPGSRTVEGTLGRGLLQEVHADLFFTSSEGFTVETGMTDFSPNEAELKKLMAANASQVVALLDHTKLGRRSIVTSIQAKDIRTLITDAGADPAWLKTLGKIRVVVADVPAGEK